MSTEETAAYLKGKIDTPVHNGIDAYRVVYRTVGPDGGPTTASGLIVLPRTDSRRLRVVSYEHGTLVLARATRRRSTVKPAPTRPVLYNRRPDRYIT
jgi:hypothetical protein